MKSVLFVTAMKDIKRDSWSAFNRTFNDYIEWFGNLNAFPIRILCFCSPQLGRVLEDRYGYIEWEPYDEDSTFFKLEQSFANVMVKMAPLAEGKTNPEFLYASYNIVNHNKCIFVHRAKQKYPNYTHYSWIDFGYQRVPEDLCFNFELLDDNRIEFESCSFPTTMLYFTSRDELLLNPEWYCLVRGSMYIVPHCLVEWYVQAYTGMVLEYLTHNRVTSDQPTVLQVALSFPDKFTFFATDDWFSLLRKYSC